MKRSLMIAGCLLALAVAVTGSASGVHAADDAKKAAPMKPAVDPKAQAELLQMLNNVVQEKDPAKLARVAQSLGDELLGSLDYQRGIAKLTIQEGLLERARGDSLLGAEEAAKERKVMKSRLEKDIDELKQTYKDDPNLAEVEIVIRVQAFRPMLLALKHQEEEFLKVVRDTTEKLARVRSDKQRLERELALVRLGVLQRKVVTVPSIGLSSYSSGIVTPPAPPAPKETLQEALKSLNGL